LYKNQGKEKYYNSIRNVLPQVEYVYMNYIDYENTLIPQLQGEQYIKIIEYKEKKSLDLFLNQENEDKTLIFYQLFSQLDIIMDFKMENPIKPDKDINVYVQDLNDYYNMICKP